MKSKVKKRSSQTRKSDTAPAAAVHELNNLLTLVLGYSQLIVDGTKRTDPNRYHAEQILKAGESAAVLTRQMADAIGRSGVPLTPACVADVHKSSEENASEPERPLPTPSRRAARRG
jgi:hypothetical protein